jgi:hypothetical protein
MKNFGKLSHYTFIFLLVHKNGRRALWSGTRPRTRAQTVLSLILVPASYSDKIKREEEEGIARGDREQTALLPA